MEKAKAIIEPKKKISTTRWGVMSVPVYANLFKVPYKERLARLSAFAVKNAKFPNKHAKSLHYILDFSAIRATVYWLF